MDAKRMSPRKLATHADVEEKTVRRWLANVDIKVREDNAQRAASALGCTPRDLWPAQFANQQPTQATTSPAPSRATLFSSRTQIPVTVWQNHFLGAQESIDILVLAATFLFDTLDGFTDALVEATARGAVVRFLVGDPDADSLALRGHEEQIGDAVTARSRTSVELLRPYAGTPGLQIRTHQTTLYTSIFRVDANMIVNFHVYGSPGRDNPVLLLSRNEDPRLWATFDRAFTRVWDSARPMDSSPQPAQ
ncbi:hypothetical protein QN239_03460 [Mycolicibacterium sp. Y3]